MALTIPIESEAFNRLRKRAEVLGLIPQSERARGPSAGRVPQVTDPEEIQGLDRRREALRRQGFGGSEAAGDLPIPAFDPDKAEAELSQRGASVIAAPIQAGLTAANTVLSPLQPSVPVGTPGGGGSAVTSPAPPSAPILEAVDRASALFGGAQIDTFNRLKKGETIFTGGLENFTERPSEVIERQRERGTLPRIFSELLTPLEGAALIKGTAAVARLTGKQIAEAASDITRESTRFVTRRERLQSLKEFGLVLDSSANTFAAPLRPFDDVANEVATGKGITEQTAARTGINPSLTRTSQTGKSITAFQRQQISADELVGTAMAGAYDAHLGQFAKDPIKDIAERAGVPYQKVLGKPDDFKKFISPESRVMIDDINQMTNDEAVRLLEDVGIDARARARPENEYYVPRNVEEIRGIELRRGTNPALNRHYDDITEGLDAGIVYGKDPRKDVELYMRWVYRTVAKKQFDDALELQSITAKRLVPEDIRLAYADAITNRREIEVLRRKVRRGISQADAQLRIVATKVAGREKAQALTKSDLTPLDAVIEQLDLLPFEDAPRVPIHGVGKQRTRELGRVQQARESLDRLKKRAQSQTKATFTANQARQQLDVRREFLSGKLENIDERLIGARSEHLRTRNTYSNRIEELRKSQETIGPGDLFGPNQPNEIALGQWHNRFFTREDSDLLEQVIGKQAAPGVFTRSLTQLVNARRFLSAVGDFAMPMIHGLTIFGESPRIWATMSLRHHQAFFDPGVQSRLIRENLSDFQWLAQHGVPIGDPEFFAALRPGQGISFEELFKRLPKGDEVQRVSRLAGKQTFGRFQASYNTGLGWARVLLLKSLRETWKSTDAELAQYIRNLTGGLDSKALGVGPGQRAAEGVWLAFSPRLLRSTMALTKDAMNPSTQVGRRSLRALANLATAATTIYVLTGMAAGKDWDEIAQGLNPLNGKRFLSHQINGDWIGVGGQIRAIAQLLSTVAVAPFKGPGDLISLNRYDNPLIRGVTGRGAQGPEIVGSVVEAFTDINALPFEEIDGPIDLLKHTGKSHLPFAAQGVIEGEKPVTTGFALQGFRTSEQTPFEVRRASRQQGMEQLDLDGEFKDLDFAQKAEVDKLVPDEINQKVADLQRNRESKVQALTDALDGIDEDIDRSIIIVAAEGPSKRFRDRLSDLNRERANRKEQERNGPQHADALEFFEELDPSEAQLDIVRDDYFNAVNDPRLENDLGDYDFDLRDQLLQEVRDRHGDLVDEVITAINADEHPLEKELRADREKLKEYWEIRDFVANRYIPEAQRAFYLAWVDAEPNEKADFRRRFGHIINPIESLVSRFQTVFRATHKEVDSLLGKWEYSTALPRNPENRRELIGAGNVR